MKKSIIVLALALLMVTSVFASPLTYVEEEANGKALKGKTVSTSDTTDLKDTKVQINLKQYPKYMTAITTTPYDGSTPEKTITKDNYTLVTHENLIEMDVDTNSWKLVPTAENAYYVTYFVYENTVDVDFSVKMNGNLKLVDTTTATSEVDPSSKNQKEVRYQMVIKGVGTSGADVTLSSTKVAETDITSTVIKTVEDTNLIGKSECNSYAFQLKGYGTDTVQYNIAGLYEATITLSITGK